jgi:hypothetical protein
MYIPPTANCSYDPNHPPNLSIAPSQAPDETALDEYAQERSIARYGIAGRVWCVWLFSPFSFPFDDADKLMVGMRRFPPCTIFTAPEPVILELGSGQSHASLHLLSELCKPNNASNEERWGGSRDRTTCEERNGGGGRLVLSDLENVVPLVRGNVDRWLRKTASCHQTTNDIGNDTKTDRGERVPDVEVVALPWGDIPAVDSLLSTTIQKPITHILMIDLVRVLSVSPVYAPTD